MNKIDKLFELEQKLREYKEKWNEFLCTPTMTKMRILLMLRQLRG